MNWFAEQRQAWIAEMLDVYGFINREHLQRKFGISQPQASHDLQTFGRAHPRVIRYDVSRKCYIRGGQTWRVNPSRSTTSSKKPLTKAPGR